MHTLTCSAKAMIPYQIDQRLLQWTSQQLLFSCVAAPGAVAGPGGATRRAKVEADERSIVELMTS